MKGKTNSNDNVVLDKELINSNDVIENIISESTDEFIECDDDMLLCIDELEREWRESYIMGMKQRVSYLRGRMGGEGRPSRIYCVDKCATNNYFLKFFVFPGEVRKDLIEFIPVSYTHLDVYKRQSYNWSCGNKLMILETKV